MKYTITVYRYYHFILLCAVFLHCEVRYNNDLSSILEERFLGNIPIRGGITACQPL